MKQVVGIFLGWMASAAVAASSDSLLAIFLTGFTVTFVFIEVTKALDGTR